MSIYPGNRRNSGNPFGNWLAIIMMAVILIGSFFVLRGIFNLLYFLAPILLIATLIIDYKVVLNFIKQLGVLFTKNPLYGIGATALTFFLYPIVFVVLLFRAFTGKKLRKFQNPGDAEREGDFVEYEELDEEPLDLDEFGKVKEKNYDNYFNKER
ncbi:hypothetical protein [Portibacter lacus]|uniref:Uncharacterized protein n=1 Tax=Portibacter lacus TaxID=1099794 RepID=A0AA37WEA8_9BACT|nr:hypothetical protein [Portibacter lacus]GLR16977.1 hypothetical protein GCM10007940_15920 [Portibacter lacus]